MTLALPTRYRRDAYHNDIIEWLSLNVPNYGTEDWCSCFQFGKGCGFLTKQPSKRAQRIMEVLGHSY